MSDCVFCRIVAGEIPAKVASRTDDAVAIHDLNPQAPIHLLVVPVRHVAAVRDAGGEDGALLLGHLMQFAAGLARDLGLDPTGYRLVANTGADGGQSVFHLHLHLLGGRKMSWPPG